MMASYGGFAQHIIMMMYVITLPGTGTAHKKGPFSVVHEGIEFCCVFTHTTKKQNHPLTMLNAPKPVKRSHSKQRHKVNNVPLPIRTPCESLAANVNVVTQPTQECRHDDDEIAASTLLALSSSPGRPPGSSPATPSHSMVDSIVARVNHQETSSLSTSIIEERVINHLYALGLRSKRVLPAIGNAPSLLFGSQVSPTMKRPPLDQEYLDPSHCLIFGEVEEVEVEVEEESDTVTIPVATVTSNFQRFNDNDRITSNNAVALRKLPPMYPAKRMIPNPLISVQSSSLPLKQDMTKMSCANLVKRIRNPLGVRSSTLLGTTL
jgi:hypothetical protein